MLAFGTSGLRGRIEDMTDQECYLHVRGFIAYLMHSDQIQPGATIVVAGDLRSSTERILQSVGRAIVDAGCQIENAGKIPTPALVYYAQLKQHPSIMVTGSHIPGDRNGIKFHHAQGEILKSEETKILAKVDHLRAQEKAQGFLPVKFDATGKFYPEIKQALPPVSGAAETSYRQRYLQVFPQHGLAGKKIVVDQHSAVGRDLLVAILEQLDAEVIPIGRSDQFVAMDTENLSRTTKTRYLTIAQQYQPFAIVSLDADSDRPLVWDEKGRFCPGDILGAVVAKELGADYAAVPISANDALEAFLQPAGIALERTRIGSPYVLAAMQAAICQGKQKVVGWEANGGFILGTDLPFGQGELNALPTRDACLPILSLLWKAAQQGSIAQVFSQLPPRYTQAGLLDDFPLATAQKIMRVLIPQEEIIQVDFQTPIIKIYYAHGQMEEIKDPQVKTLQPILQIKQRLEKKYFTAQLGFGAIRSFNLLDGVRICFIQGDVAHIRPSGNAPQLRVYANADTQERADEIVRLNVEANGILRKMERDFS